MIEPPVEDAESTEVSLGVHIFSASAAMVGVCMTVIGILRVIISLKPVQTMGDDLLALDALFFLGATFFSYAALKARTKPRRQRLERVADIIFLFAMTVMAFACFLMVYALTNR
ncbi:MAG: hypothetical protein QM758_26555 [Armatimonas sp.]